jgi:DNA repair protein RadD
MITLRPYQEAAIDAVYRHLAEREDNPCVVCPTGCHAAGHPILMADGHVLPVEQIAVGDQIMGPDSQPRTVLALCRGEDDLFRITPRKGEPFVVNGDHVLSLVATNEGKLHDCCRKGGERADITVREYLGKSVYWRHLHKLHRVGVDFPNRPDLPMPPYILGLLLGDGSIINQPNLTSIDDAVINAWTQYAESVNCCVRLGTSRPDCPHLYVSRKRGESNPITDILVGLDLAGRDCATKFIPDIYLTASRADRLALLAGLLDTDGSVTKSGYEIATKSAEMASDIVFLARSLGYWAADRQKYSYCQTGNGDWYHRIHIYGNAIEIPLRLVRKRCPARRQKKDILRTGFTVEPVGRGNFYGFNLDGDHLYVDGHFLVHHNSGKGILVGRICADVVNRWNGRILVLTHVKELVDQNATQASRFLSPLLVGVNSAGLKRRDLDHPVIVAGIQSVYQKACDLGRFDLVLIDECHLIPQDGEGMYRTFLKDARAVNPKLRLIGLTATPFRLKDGEICGPDNLLNHICYEIGVKELIRDGFLSPLISKAGKTKADTTGLHIRGGEFIPDEVEYLMDTDDLVRAACAEIAEQTRNRKACLVFAAGVQHAEHVQAALAAATGTEVACIFGHTPDGERDRIIARFKKGELRYLVNVAVLTTGFDAPQVDCVVLLRPTMSAGLFYQMVGRGFRIAPGKDDCLVLDFGSNLLRHGPVDALKIKDKGQREGGEAPAKECPQCQAVIAAGFAACPHCGYLFPPPEKEKHEGEASSAGVLSGQVTVIEYAVRDVFYAIHQKRGAPPEAPKTLRVEYEVGLNR